MAALLDEEMRGYGVDPSADRLTASQLRAAKLRIKTKRKDEPQVISTMAGLDCLS